jgi:hypothetical protein
MVPAWHYRGPSKLAKQLNNWETIDHINTQGKLHNSSMPLI